MRTTEQLLALLRADLRGFHSDLGKQAMVKEKDPKAIAFLADIRDDLGELVLKLNRYLDN